MTSWSIYSPAENDESAFPTAISSLSGNGKDFVAQSDLYFSEAPTYVGGCTLVTSESYSKAEWLSDNGSLIRAEMKKLVKLLAVKMAQELALPQ